MVVAKSAYHVWATPETFGMRKRQRHKNCNQLSCKFGSTFPGARWTCIMDMALQTIDFLFRNNIRKPIDLQYKNKKKNSYRRVFANDIQLEGRILYLEDTEDPSELCHNSLVLRCTSHCCGIHLFLPCNVLAYEIDLE